MENTIEIVVRVNGKDMHVTDTTNRLYGLIAAMNKVGNSFGGKYNIPCTPNALADACFYTYTSQEGLDAAENNDDLETFAKELFSQDLITNLQELHGTKPEYIVFINADTHVSTDIKEALTTNAANTLCLVVRGDDEGQTTTLVTETGYVLICNKARSEPWDVIDIDKCNEEDLEHNGLKFSTALEMIGHFAKDAHTSTFEEM